MQDYSYFSDLYKDVHGVRPHGLIQSTAELVEWLQSELDRQIKEEREERQREIDICMSVGAVDEEQALHWIDQAEYSAYWR